MLESKKQEFLQNSILKLQYLRYSKDTKKIYIHYIDEFLKSLKGISPSKLKANDFQNYLNNYNFTDKSGSLQNQVISSLKFFYEKVLGHKYLKIDFTRPRKEYKLPVIIPEQHLINSINKITNLKHKSILL